MNEKDKRHIETVKKMYEGDEAERANIAADIVWHVPGYNPVSGDYHGFAAYTTEMSARMAPLARWDFHLGNVMVNGNYVVTTWQLQGVRKGQSVDVAGAHMMRLNDDGRIVEGWGFTDDQDALDAFFSA
ncbi:MAG TPA: nuclear transport factor 2 family protein [Chloroflexota bacterium]|nr:nuclear transport factor 2 family protein [Chloroflexota bacterium]HUM67323.1 nuclear transport factor 2 family protein [Chloroflexota bacterium]